jgi:hypothetical protein
VEASHIFQFFPYFSEVKNSITKMVDSSPSFRDDAAGMRAIHHTMLCWSAVFFLMPAISAAEEPVYTGPRLAGPLPTLQWSPPSPPEPLPPVPVLRETEYVLLSQGRSIIVQEVTPPAEPVPTRPPPAPVVSEEERAARLERWKEAWAARPKYEVHFFSCTVYDAKYTQVRWSHKGQSYVAWSKLDWNDFAGMNHFLAGPEPATRHSLIFGIGNVSTTDPGLPGSGMAALPKDLPSFTEGGPDFVITKGAANDAEATEGFRLLHELHAREKDALLAARANREQVRRDQKAWMDANPPQPRDTIIRIAPAVIRP